MKILLIHNDYRQPGGEDVVVEQESKLLERAGHEVVTYRRSNWETTACSGLGKLGLVKRIIWANDARQEVAHLLCNENPQLVHVHNTFMAISPSIYSACREAGVPVVQTLHNYRLFCPAAYFYRQNKVCEECYEHSLWRSIRYGCYRNSRRATSVVALMLQVHRSLGTLSRAVDTYVALTEFSRRKFIAAGLPAEKVRVKPNFVYQDPGRRKTAGGYAAFAGRLSPEKGVSTLLAAWARLRTRIPLLVIGDGPLSPALQAEAAKLGLNDVHFKGPMSHEQTVGALKNARFLLFPSRWYESFPMVIAEAFACATPVICSRLGAMEEIVQDGRTGLHFTTGEANDLAAKVEWACSHPQEMRCMGDQARQEYETKYTAQKNYSMLMEIYQDAITRHRTPHSDPVPGNIRTDLEVLPSLLPEPHPSASDQLSQYQERSR